MQKNQFWCKIYNKSTGEKRRKVNDEDGKRISEKFRKKTFFFNKLNNIQKRKG